MKRLLSFLILLVPILTPAVPPAAEGVYRWPADHDLELRGFVDARSGARYRDDPYEKELAVDLTASLQYYLEWMQKYDRYRRTAGSFARDEYRHVATLRLTRLLLNQNLTLSFFACYSPSDDEGYLRPNVRYKITDQWAMGGGGNIFFGSADHTFFGQFENNSNLYAGVRRNF